MNSDLTINRSHLTPNPSPKGEGRSTSLLKLIFVIIMLTAGFAAKSQQLYFAYIQTENKQPFYVKISDRMLSSSSSGYVVIPKLIRGTYNMTVGFPKDVFPQQQFPLVVEKSDAGYLLKEFPGKGWGLYNLQTMELAMAGQSAPVKTATGDDAFAGALGAATGTPVQVPRTKEQVPSTKEQVPSAKEQVPSTKEQVASAKEQVATNSSFTSPQTSAKASVVTSPPTPLPKVEGSAVSKVADVPAETVPVDAATAGSKDKKDKKPIDVDEKINQAIDKTVSAVKGVFEKKPEGQTGNGQQAIGNSPASGYDANAKPVVAFNSDCKSQATEEDFLKLRKKMAGETGNEAMVAAARKAFKTKCYSTEQVKNLSALFLNDSGRYDFFDAAYPRVNDSANFPSLVSLLSDNYYVTRFNAMIRK